METASLSFDSRTGVRCKGVFDVTAFHPLPSGQWGITVTGIWSPEKEIAEYLPSLLRMAESYHINEQFAEDYVRRGLENLRRMTRETSEKAARAAREIRESSMAAYQERQRSMEYIDYKRTGTIRGEQEWLSQAEGGALYKSDHRGLSRVGEVPDGPEQVRASAGKPGRYRREEPETRPRTELRCYGHLRRRHGGSKAFPVAGAGGEPCPFRGERFGIHHLISTRERNFSIMATVLSIFSSPTASSKSMSSSS